MGDSDDDFDSRRNRDKFRRERDDFSGHRGSNNRGGGGEWNDGRDRPNHFRRPYHGGPMGGRDFPPRYNRSPGRYDMSPPQTKRLRHEWDGPDQSSSNPDANAGPSYGPTGVNQQSNINSSNDQLNKDPIENATQPALLSFKNFLLEQEDNIDQEEAVKRYNDYKTDFKKTQIAEFFNAHKDDDWFKHKYHPDEYCKLREAQKQTIQKRLDIFMDLYNKGFLDNVSVDVDHQNELIKLLDSAVIKMEGGDDQELRTLDITASSNDDTASKPASEKIDDKSNHDSMKNAADKKRKRTDSKSDDGTVSDGDNAESKENSGENKSTTHDNDNETGEVADAPRLLHRTASIFFRHLPMQTTKEDLENICKQYDGFRRVCITDPAPERKFSRRGWATFDHSVQIRNICYELNSTKLHDATLNAIVNRELKNRVRTINGIAHHKTIVRNDLRLIAKLIKRCDERWKFWGSEENNRDDPKVTVADDSEISSSTNQHKSPMGFHSSNPLLKNITEYLVDEGDPEEEELLGDSSTHCSNTMDIDKELNKILDRLILYLRIVYSVDFYNGTEYGQEDSMPNRCGIIHVRGTPSSSAAQNELANVTQQSEARLKNFISLYEKLDDEEAIRLGAKNEDDEIEKFINANCQEISKDKWSCPLSGKKFKGPEFVRKHILNKHQDKVDQAKKEVLFFNNYVYDPKRPQLPEHPSNRPGATPTASHPSGLPLPTPMAAQPLLPRAPLWPTMSAPPHAAPHNYFPNHYNPIRQPRPPFMYHGAPGGGHIHRPPNNRPLRSYEDLDAPNEI